jgi:hypothetical protein
LYGYLDNLALIDKFGFAMLHNPMDNMCIHYSHFMTLCPHADPASLFQGILAEDELSFNKYLFLLFLILFGNFAAIVFLKKTK